MHEGDFFGGPTAGVIGNFGNDTSKLVVELVFLLEEQLLSSPVRVVVAD